MTVAPLPLHPDNRLSGAIAARALRRRMPSRAAIIRRRRMVALLKHFLPLVAFTLLAVLALWPEIVPEVDRARVSVQRLAPETESGQMKEASYHGVDDRDRPYTVTATIAQQDGPERINLTAPKADMSLASGNWIYVTAKQGVYLQHAGQLDLSGDVTLYRDDGTTMQTDSAAIDLKQGAAVGAEMVHAEGPSGTLDAQGFSLVDRATTIQFSGPGHMVLNQRGR
jgi:lipopolysaccharide export system protein LptC